LFCTTTKHVPWSTARRGVCLSALKATLVLSSIHNSAIGHGAARAVTAERLLCSEKGQPSMSKDAGLCRLNFGIAFARSNILTAIMFGDAMTTS
jgi:hypothetical protein